MSEPVIAGLILLAVIVALGVYISRRKHTRTGGGSAGDKHNSQER